MLLPDPSEIPEEEIAAYRAAVERLERFPAHRKWPATGEGAVHPYFANLLQAPPLADHVSALGGFFRSSASRDVGYAASDREWADLVVARELRWNRVFYSHMTDAVESGVRTAAIRALYLERFDELSEAEEMLRRYIVAVCRGTVAADLADEVRSLFGNRGMIEFTAFIGYLMMNFRVMAALSVPDRTDREVLERLNGIVEEQVEGETLGVDP